MCIKMSIKQVNYSSSFEEESTENTATSAKSNDYTEIKTENESGTHQLSESNTSRISESNNISKDVDLSPWEKWLISKARKKREEVLVKDAEHQMKKIESLKFSKEKLQKQQLCDLKYEAWLASKNAALSCRKTQQKLESESKQKLDETKKAEAREKSHQEFDKWIKLKMEDKNEREALLREKANDDRRHQEEKRTLNEREYSKWLQKASKISLPEYRCFGYTSGKLISWKC